MGRADTLERGTVLEGRYEIVRSIRSGGMGAVYEALDLRLARARCAVKQMLANISDDATFKRRFQEEMEILSRLHHQGIPRVRDYFVAGATCTIVMDFVEGQNLEEELEQHLALTGRPFEPAKAIGVAVQVLDILEYLHSRKPPVLHRDIKPANLIVEHGTDRVTLVDFGLARFSKETLSTQTIVGTLGYCPMEQLKGQAGPQSDIYALGATLFHLLSGEPPAPFSIPPLASVAKLDENLARIVDKSVAEKPEDRFEDAASFKKALLSYQLTPVAPPETEIMADAAGPVGGSHPAAASKRPGPVLAVAGIGLGLLVLMGLVASSKRVPKSSPVAQASPSVASRTPTPAPTSNRTADSSPPASRVKTPPVSSALAVRRQPENRAPQSRIAAARPARPPQGATAATNPPPTRPLRPISEEPAYPVAQRTRARARPPAPATPEASPAQPVTPQSAWVDRDPLASPMDAPYVGKLILYRNRGAGTRQEPGETLLISGVTSPPNPRMRIGLRRSARQLGWSVDSTSVQPDGAETWTLSKSEARGILTFKYDPGKQLSHVVTLTRQPCVEMSEVQRSLFEVARDFGWVR